MTDPVERQQGTGEGPRLGFPLRPPAPPGANGLSSPAVTMAGRRPRARFRPDILSAIAAGGAVGAPARYLIGRAVHISPGSFPWGTFWVNLTGSFVLGLLLTLIVERWPPTRYVRPFAAVGFLGAYTTFSTFGVEADRLIAAGRIAVAAAYVVGTLVGAVAAVYLGISLARLGPGEVRR